jgi:choline-glycine betaine transporter
VDSILLSGLFFTLIWDRIYGRIGDAIDILCRNCNSLFGLATLFGNGSATNCGRIKSSSEYDMVYKLKFGGITAIATVLLGVDKGVQFWVNGIWE